MTLWTNETASIATGGKATGTWAATGVAIDSRTMKPGELYLAFKGERVDGHQFCAHAISQGASACVVHRPVEGVPAEKLLVVGDTFEALRDLSRFNRARFAGRVVGLTGSVGKTSTKEMLRAALSAHGETFASHGNFNNHIGTPLNLANLPLGAKFSVFEMGMNHAGEIAELTHQVKPEVALITAVEAVHLEFFDSVSGIADAKSEIFEGMSTDGVAILNRDNAYFEHCLKKARARGIRCIISFGVHAEADVRVVNYRSSGAGSRVEASVLGREVAYTLSTIGAHWATTSASVLAVSEALGLDAAKTANALSGFSEVAGRGQLEAIRLSGKAITLVDDSYNASPAAMRAAFAKLKELRDAGAVRGRIIAALGDMRELGPTGPQLHAELAEAIVQSGIDMVFTAGSLMKHLHNALPAALRGEHVPEAKQLLSVLRDSLQEGDVLLIKGSHGSLMYTLADALKNEGALKHAV